MSDLKGDNKTLEVTHICLNKIFLFLAIRLKKRNYG